MATVDRDGTFRIDDVPPGVYSLNVLLQRNQAGQLQNHRFSVPTSREDPSVQPVDLGVLKLEKP